MNKKIENNEVIRLLSDYQVKKYIQNLMMYGSVVVKVTWDKKAKNTKVRVVNPKSGWKLTK